MLRGVLDDSPWSEKFYGAKEPKEKASVRGRASGFAIRSHRIEGFAIPPFLYRIANANTPSCRITNPPERDAQAARGSMYSISSVE